MLKPVVIQDYSQGIAFDSTGNRNHGVPIDVTYNAASRQDGFLFAAADSRVSVASSPSLNDLTSILAGVRFQLQPPAEARRYNLVEGYLSFALFIGPDLSLNGTIYDVNGNWIGANTASGVCTANTWHTASLYHDGISTLTISLDGTLVAQTSNAVGPVRSVGNLGIAVGHWPNPENLYAFSGDINYFGLAKYYLEYDVLTLLDPCCTKLGAVQEVANKLRGEGITLENVQQAYKTLFGTVLSDATRAIAGNSSRTQTAVALGVALANALAAHDSAGIDQVIARATALTKSWAMPSQASLERAITDALTATKAQTGDVRKVLNALCLKELADRFHLPGRR
jgi:hypothetical protein